MIQVKFVDGGELVAPDEIGLVALMAGQSYDKGTSLEGYMTAYARRAVTAEGVTVNTNSPEEFVKSLTDSGLITSLKYIKTKNKEDAYKK